MRVRQLTAAVGVAAAVFFTAAQPSSALMVKIATTALTAKSDAVVIGTVTGKECLWDEDGKFIITRGEVSCERVLKGDSALAGSVIVVRHIGGEVGEIGLAVSDQPRLRTGARVLLFLRNLAGTDEFTLVGMDQGQYNVQPDEASGEDMVEAQARCVIVMSPPGEVRAASIKEREGKRSLAVFVAEILQAVERKE